MPTHPICTVKRELTAVHAAEQLSSLGQRKRNTSINNNEHALHDNHDIPLHSDHHEEEEDTHDGLPGGEDEKVVRGVEVEERDANDDIHHFAKDNNIHPATEQNGGVHHLEDESDHEDDVQETVESLPLFQSEQQCLAPIEAALFSNKECHSFS